MLEQHPLSDGYVWRGRCCRIAIAPQKQVQSLADVPFPFIVVDYFLEDRYIPEINRDNPLGWKGRVADEYGGMFACACSKYCLM